MNYYKRFLQKISHPRLYDYYYNFKKAYIHSEKLGLKQDWILAPKKYNLTNQYKMYISHIIASQIYDIEKMELKDLALKCFLISNKLKNFLKITFDIDSIITTGNVYWKDKRHYYEPFSISKARLKGKKGHVPFRSHTWLTLENLDIVNLQLKVYQFMF